MPVDSQMQAVLDQLTKFGAPPIEKSSPEIARSLPTLKNAVEEMLSENAAMRSLTLLKPNPEPVGQISHILIPGAAGDIVARVFTPKGDGPFPVLVYFHGGGWVIANLDVYESSCRALCNAAECIVVSVAYRQAPEHKYPAAVDDAYMALQSVMKNVGNINGDPTRIAVGGESAGANLATVACLKARDEGEAYARRLLEAGVPVFAKRYDGVTHEFFGLAGAVPKAKQAVEDAANALKQAFALQGDVISAPSKVHPMFR